MFYSYRSCSCCRDLSWRCPRPTATKGFRETDMIVYCPQRIHRYTTIGHKLSIFTICNSLFMIPLTCPKYFGASYDLFYGYIIL
ncbi:Uncharacterized protein M6B38_218245 [Iris pallida]|uniref:Uncharacterized protein n=1 Tax=Iris pallida TaxID=29817 RepID=A0AAX6DXB2_IRIPA|nr:Uncharacterized protein M6B38_218245 [Iris pallida]